MTAVSFATVGEAMAVLIGGAVEVHEAMSLGTPFELGIGGAESNVAMTLAALGHDVSWVSAVGDDPFGRVIKEQVGRAGVDVSHVRVDADAPTGLYVKMPRLSGTDVRYFRRGSAASLLDRRALPALSGARVVHLSGILPALGAAPADLVDAIVVERRVTGRVSFDVNHRPALWPGADASESLLRTAGHADIVFVGRDEAESVWGAATADAVRDLLPRVPVLVVKDAERGATMFTRDRRWHVPSPQVDVVEPVGAGDAFAAGWLSAYTRGMDPVRCLALGHALAERALLERGDLAVVASRESVEARADEILRSRGEGAAWRAAVS